MTTDCIKRRPPISVKCDNCGKPVTKHQCHITGHNFCCGECQLEWLHREKPWDEDVRKSKIGFALKRAYKEGRKNPPNPKGKTLPEGMIARMRGRTVWNQGLTKDTDARIRAYSEKLKGRCVLDGEKQKLRQAMLICWRKSEYVRKQMMARRLKPNMVELKLLSLLMVFGFEYVGDGKLIIGGKCPDYSNSDHKLIELYGDYWHNGEDSQERIGHFSKHNYACLVIWEHELDNLQSVLAKVKQFVKEDIK